jgi:hypothetical protein
MATGIASSPFLDVQSFVREEPELPAPVPPRAPSWSPFLSVYESADGAQEMDGPLRETYATLVNDLYDEEFDEALFELLTGARNLHQDHLASGHSVADADRIVTRHFAELARESESMLDSMSRELESRDAVGIEREIDHFADSYVPAAGLEPEFQEFLGKLVKKIGRGVRAVAKTAIAGVAKFAIGPALKAAKAILPKLLNRVLQKAIGKLPEAVQPAAHTLARRLGLSTAPAPAPAAPSAPALPAVVPSAPDPAALPAPTDALPALPVAAAPQAPPVAPATPEPVAHDAGSPVQPTAGAEVPDMQLEFDEMFAQAMLSDNEGDMELQLARASAGANGAAPVFADLDEARERLGDDLANLKEGENPAPYLENFLPAVLPALKIATRLIGRPRVVNFLAGLLGKLIGNLVGPQQTPALSRAMVDAGLKLINLERPDEEEVRQTLSPVTATVEETLARVASLPDHVLDNQELLEGFALEAFEQAAAANLPALFSERTYQQRPGLLEGGLNAAWVMLPIRRPRYKRCSRTFNVRITPHMAEAIETFDGAPLSEYLQDQLGYPEGEDVPAEIHLYEVVAGGSAADIARGETETPGLGAADEVTLSQLQPLTHESAGVLFGRPGLGRRLMWGTGIRTVAPGQRLFHMVVGRRPVTIIGPRGRRRIRRLVRIDAVLDTTRDQIRVCVFLSEVQAQRLAVRLRQQTHVGTLAVGFNTLLGRRLPSLLHGRRRRRLRIIHPGVAPGVGSIGVLDRLPQVVPQAFITKVQGWMVAAFTEYGKTQAAKFLTASEDPADGVTLVFTIDHPPGLKELGQALAQPGTAAGVAAAPAGAEPTVRVEALPGYRCD